MRSGSVWTRHDQGSPFSPTALVIRFVINLAGMFLADSAVPGITIDDTESLLLATALFAVVNILLRPIATMFSFCLIILTFGLFVLVINTALLGVTAWLSGQIGLGFSIDGFWSAFFGALIISIVSLVASTFVKAR